MKVKDKDFKMYIPEGEIAQVVERLAEEVSRDYRNGDLVVCPVLTGAFLFAADLVRKLTVPCEVRFVKYTSYSGMSSTGKVTGQLPFPRNVEDRDVLIVEDVVDSGLTIGYMIEELKTLRPRSIRVCTLFFKPGAFKGNYKVDYVGREIGDEFIVGYGMDYDEEGRELKDVWQVV